MAKLPSIESIDVLSFPEMESISEEKKQNPKYNLDVAKAINYLYKKGNTELSSGLDTFIDELRLYAKGKQNPDKYKTYNSSSSGSSYDPTTGTDSIISSDRDNVAKGWRNVNWSVVSPLPNTIRSIKGHFINVDYDIKAHNIDIDSSVEEDKRMQEVWNKAPQNFGSMINQARKVAGLPPKQPDYIPTSYYELEQLKKEGTFKEAYIREQEKVMLHIENISNWDRSLKEKVVDDLITLSYAFAFAEYDRETCKVKWKYSDPKDTIIQYSKETDFNDVDYAGMFTYPTISSLRQIKDYIYNAETGEKITDAKIREIANSYKDYSDNVSETEWNGGLQEDVDEHIDYGRFKVCVQKCWWIDVDAENKIEYTKANGKKRFYKYDDTVKKLGKREKLKTIKSRKLYYCSWIVGTDYVYDFGLMPNQPRPTYARPKIPLVGIKLGEKSIVHTLKEVCDYYQIAWLRLQNALSKAAHDGYAVNISQLINMTDGGKAFSPDDFIQMWREEGIVFYESYNNSVGVGGDALPIHFVDGGLKDMINKEVALMDQAIRMIPDLTGISPIVLGAAPSPDAPVRTTQMSATSTVNSLQTIIDGCRRLKEELATVSSPMAQLSMKDEKAAKEWSKVIGKEGVETLRMAKDMGIQYGIQLVARPSDDEWNELIQSARESKAKRSPGVPGINDGQFAWIIDQRRKGGNFGEVAIKLNAWVKQDEERIRKERNETVTLQGEQNAKLEDMKAKSQQQTNQTELIKGIKTIGTQLDADIMRREKESRLLKEEQDNEYKNKERLLSLEYEKKKELAVIEAKLAPKTAETKK